MPSRVEFNRKNCRVSFFRHSGFAQAILDALALCHKGWIVAYLDAAPAVDGEGRIERQSSLHTGPRFVESAEMGQGGGEIEMR